VRLLHNSGLSATSTQANPEDIDLAAIETDLEFLIERVEPLRREQAVKPLCTMIGSAAIVVAWIELFWRRCP
jgi:hypothetical protein